ncbi:MAG: glycosyltransferase family 9 protein [Acidobacteriota bacterium]
MGSSVEQTVEASARRILLVRIGALGDTLMATPVARALKRAYPGARVDFLCSGSASPLLRLNPWMDTVHPLRQRNVPFFLSLEKLRLALTLRSIGFDFAVLLESARKYRFLLARAGLKTIRSFEETPFDPHLHSIVNNLRAAGLANWREFPPAMELPVSEVDREQARELLKGLPRPLVGLHPGYGPPGRKKNQSRRLKGWNPTHFVHLGQLLIDQGSSLVLTGSKQDRRDTESISPPFPPDRCRSLAGRTTLKEMAAVIAELDLFISVDSGPAHMAAAVGTPLVVLWGPAKLKQVRPLSSGGPVEIIRHPVPCSPCYDTPWMATCRKNVCLQSITPDQVFQLALKLLGDDPVRERPGKAPARIGGGW